MRRGRGTIQRERDLDKSVALAQGDMLYKGASLIQRIPAGTTGQVLEARGAAAPVWSVPGFLRANCRRYAWNIPNRGATTRTTVGTGSSTPANVGGNTADETEGAFQPFTTTGVSGNVAGGSVLATGSTGFDTQLGWLPACVIFFKTGSSIANYRLWAGMFSATPSGVETPGASSAIHGIALRYSTGASDPGFVVVSSNGASDTVSSQVMAAAADTAYLLGIRAVTTSSVEVWLGNNEANMALVTTVAGTLPGTTTALFSSLTVTTLTNSARTVKYGHLHQGSA